MTKICILLTFSDKLSNFHSQALCLTDEPGSREEFRQLIQEHFNQGTMCNKCIPGDPGTNSDHESPGDPGTNSDHESPGDPGTNSDHESPGDPGTNNDHESPGDPGTNSDHESPGDPGTNSDHESPGDPGTNSDHESPGDPGTNSDHESPGDPGTNKETSVDQCTNHVTRPRLIWEQSVPQNIASSKTIGAKKSQKECVQLKPVAMETMPVKLGAMETMPVKPVAMETTPGECVWLVYTAAGTWRRPCSGYSHRLENYDHSSVSAAATTAWPKQVRITGYQSLGWV